MPDFSRVLITGGDGRIASEIDFGIKLGHEKIDITDINSIRKALEEYSPSAVLNLASLDLKASQNNPFLANKINALGVYNLALETKRINIPLIIISSGAVFNGKAEDNFNEDSIPNPSNIYGQTKYQSEINALVNPKSYIIRTGWLFGFIKNGNFFNKMLDSAKLGNKVMATYDQFGSFTYIRDFVNELKNVISNNEPGIYHIANSGRANAEEFAKEMISQLRSVSKIDRISISESEKEGILRSRSEVLISKKVKMRNWQEALREKLNGS